MYEKYIKWLISQEDILAILLVGSHAHGTFKDNSDIDLMIICDCYMNYVNNPSWLHNIENFNQPLVEGWGKSKSLRVFFINDKEVEYTFSDRSWLSTDPPDEGTVSFKKWFQSFV